MYLRLLPILGAAAMFAGGCTSTKLDAAATAQNAANVSILAKQNEALQIRVGADPPTLEAARQFNASAVRLADAMREAAK